MQMPTSSTVWWAPVCEVAGRVHVEIEPAVAREQVEHVVEEADAGLTRSPAPSPSSARLTWTSVSPVVAVDLGCAAHDRRLSRMRASIERAWSSKPSARATGAAASSEPRRVGDPHLGEAATEMLRATAPTRTAQLRSWEGCGSTRRCSRRMRSRRRRRRTRSRRASPAAPAPRRAAPTSCRCSGANASRECEGAGRDRPRPRSAGGWHRSSGESRRRAGATARAARRRPTRAAPASPGRARPGPAGRARSAR